MGSIRRKAKSSHHTFSGGDGVWHWHWIGRRGYGVLDAGFKSGDDDWRYRRIRWLVLSVLIRRRFLAWPVWLPRLKFSFAAYQLARKRCRNLRGFDEGERRAYN
jgi:hypothetical protein